MALELVSPCPEWALPLAWEWLRPSLRMLADDFAMASLEKFTALAAQIDAGGGKTWAIKRDGSFIGWISFEPVNKVSGVMHGFMSRRGWGRKNSDAALKAALEQIFAAGYERVSFPVLACNYPVRGLLRRVGAKEEGLLRSFTTCGGELADLGMFGMTKADFYGTTDGARQFAGRTEQHEGSQHGDEQRELLEHGRHKRLDFADVQPDADGRAISDRSRARERRPERPEHHTVRNVWDEQYQPDVPVDRGQAAAKPVVKRVRKQRSQRKRGATN